MRCAAGNGSTVLVVPDGERRNALRRFGVGRGLSQRSSRYALVALLVLGVALGVDALCIEPARLLVNRQELHLPHWPAQLSGLRVAFVSDLHVGSPHWGVERLRTLVERVNEEKPDLILLGGDYLIDDVPLGRHARAEVIAAELARLRAPLGVFGVLGNHDWWNEGEHVREKFEAVGLTLLDDQARRIDARGASFCLLGLRDEYFRQRNATAEMKLALPGLPLIVLTHEPDIFSELDARVSLTLAGHTHGGQVKLPLLGRLVVPSRFGSRYAAGHIVENGRHLFVTTGVGTSILPVRFGVPPEIAVLTLR